MSRSSPQALHTGLPHSRSGPTGVALVKGFQIWAIGPQALRGGCATKKNPHSSRVHLQTGASPQMLLAREPASGFAKGAGPGGPLAPALHRARSTAACSSASSCAMKGVPSQLELRRTDCTCHTCYATAVPTALPTAFPTAVPAPPGQESQSESPSRDDCSGQKAEHSTPAAPPQVGGG